MLSEPTTRTMLDNAIARASMGVHVLVLMATHQDVARAMHVFDQLMLPDTRWRVTVRVFTDVMKGRAAGRVYAEVFEDHRVADARRDEWESAKRALVR